MEGIAGLAILGGIFALMCISGFVAQMIASARGHTSLAFFWVAFFLPLIGILAAALIPSAITTKPLQPEPQPQPTSPDLTTQLQDLAQLHQTGELTDDEYQTAKQRILDNPT